MSKLRGRDLEVLNLSAKTQLIQPALGVSGGGGGGGGGGICGLGSGGGGGI